MAVPSYYFLDWKDLDGDDGDDGNEVDSHKITCLSKDLSFDKFHKWHEHGKLTKTYCIYLEYDYGERMKYLEYP